MQPSTARDSGQVDPRRSTTDIPSPQSAALGLHPVARRLLLINRHSYSCKDPLYFNQVAWIPQFPVRRKYLRVVPYTSRVIAILSNFVAMATGFGRGRICRTSFNSPIRKIIRRVQTAEQSEETILLSSISSCSSRSNMGTE